MPRPTWIAPLLLATLFAACGERGDRALSREENVDYAEVEQGGSAAAPAPVTAPAEGTATGTDLGLTPGRYSDDDAASAEQRRQNAAPPGAQPSPPAQADTAAPAPSSADPAPVRMIIRTGNATVEVDSLEPAIARVQQLAQQLGGYVANTSMQSGRQNTREATLELKIPAARWDQAVAALRPLGKLESMTTSTEDVGEEYVDVTARMNNARRLEQRLVELLASRTGRLEDVLAVERELARVREQIERYEGRLRFLRARVANSTLTVRLHEPMPVIGGRPGSNPIVEAFRDAWDNFVGFVAGLIAMAGWLIPLLALTALAVWLFRRFVPWRPGNGDRPGLGMPRGGAPGPHAGPPPPASGPAAPGAGPGGPASGP
ncbi:MAG TPA: DUF4349 domain-containing protein, partial [Longimicrobium sp.]|nr:DUF4349 domain-containing protein [Longimicrobium sp.]